MTIVARIHSGDGRVALIAAQPEPMPEAMYHEPARMQIEGGPFIDRREWHIDKIAAVIGWARDCDDFDFMVQTLQNYSEIVSVEVKAS